MPLCPKSRRNAVLINQKAKGQKQRVDVCCVGGRVYVESAGGT